MAGAVTCCGSKRVAGGGALPAFGTGCPCRPVLDRPLVVTAAKATLDLDQTDHTPLFVALEPLPMMVPGTAVDFQRRELLPPPDLVITLGVLLI